VDLVLVLAVAYYLTRWLGWPYKSPIEMLRVDFASLPYGPFFGIYMAYMVLCEWLLGTTLGKSLMGLSVVSDMGERPSLWATLVRNLIGFAERLPHTFMFVAAPMIIFGPRRQRLGDMLARTFVVQTRALEVFKVQRAEATARGQAGSDGSTKADPGLLFPPVDAKLWDFSGGSAKKNDPDKKDKER